MWYIWHLQSTHALFVNIWILKDAVILNCEFETFQFPLRRKNLQCPAISSNIHLRHYIAWLSAFPGCIYTLLIFLISSLSLLSTFSIWPLSSLFSSYLRFSLSRYFLPSFSLPVFLLFLFPCIPDSTPFPLISNSPNSSFILLTVYPSFLHSLFFPFIPCILLANTPQHLFPPLTQFCPVQSGHTLAVINIGAPAGGMSTAVRAFVRFSLCQGHTVLGIRDGINGLFDDKVMNTR